MLGGRHYGRGRRDHCRAGAQHREPAQPADGGVVAATRAAWRTTLLGGDRPGGVGRPDRTAGRRFRLGPCVAHRHRAAAPASAGAGSAGAQEPCTIGDSGRAHHRHAAGAGRRI
ncbi:hypothetical protein G6F50_017301 [Rhizopus delemar]|uniref:Uncharacterized protein n=1 Tax=Rhizopus delemar TaxID=936053 RepID=A0A9P6XQS9_9FUNG|nr:hypothetical protein G6F50_017301 [Rhizopus delemar]